MVDLALCFERMVADRVEVVDNGPIPYVGEGLAVEVDNSLIPWVVGVDRSHLDAMVVDSVGMRLKKVVRKSLFDR